jgi:hypothetical protein
MHTYCRKYLLTQADRMQVSCVMSKSWPFCRASSPWPNGKSASGLKSTNHMNASHNQSRSATMWHAGPIYCTPAANAVHSPQRVCCTLPNPLIKGLQAACSSRCAGVARAVLWASQHTGQDSTHRCVGAGPTTACRCTLCTHTAHRLGCCRSQHRHSGYGLAVIQEFGPKDWLNDTKSASGCVARAPHNIGNPTHLDKYA